MVPLTPFPVENCQKTCPGNICLSFIWALTAKVRVELGIDGLGRPRRPPSQQTGVREGLAGDSQGYTGAALKAPKDALPAGVCFLLVDRRANGRK